MAKFYESVQEQAVAIKETIIDLFSDIKLFIIEAWPVLLVLFSVLVIALWVVDPVPPRHVVMAVGAKDSADDFLGKKYKEYFANKGINLELINTNGSVENLDKLIDMKSPVMASFVMTGTANQRLENVQTLGSVSYEPLWCFYKGNDNFYNRSAEGLKTLIQKKINIGSDGSGTKLQTTKILDLLGIDKSKGNFTTYHNSEAADMLIEGKIDGACIVDSIDSVIVQKLLSSKDVHLSYMSRAEAFTKKIPSLEAVTVPKSSLDIINDIPKENMQLLATTREILIDKDLHPAIQTLFLMAATRINGGETFFSKESEFPGFKDNSLQRSQEAETFYAKGEPYMVSWLPFWISEFARRLFLTLLPLAAIAYPIIKSTPNYYKNRVRAKINKLYGEIKFFEQQLVDNYQKEKLPEYLEKINDIEAVALKMKVPKSISQDYYTMRSSIEFINNRLVNGVYADGTLSVEESPQLELDFYKEETKD